MINTSVIIVGAGLTGLITAKYLEKLGIDYIVLDKYKIQKLAKTDLRTTAINYTVSQNFQFLGLWNKLESQVSKIDNILIRNNLNEADLYFSKEMIKASPMGYIIPNSVIKNHLIDCLDNEYLMSEQEVVDVKTKSDYVIATTDKSLEIKAKLILVSDGKYSSLKKLFNISELQHDYQQASHVFNVKHERSHDNLALEQFLSDGPIAFLPLKDPNQSSIVYTKSNNVTISNIDDIEAELNLIASDTYGAIEIISEIKSFPLSVSHSNQYYRSRMLFLGDSLHSMHPIAGQGFNLTMRDIERITHLILKHKTLGMDIGSNILLKSFEKIRKKDNILMLGSTHALVKLFSNDNKLMNSARNLGLKLFGKSQRAKKSAIAYAMGLK
jgi:2-octaprenyl-6-methoxyphenol hydroxylase